MSPWVIGFVVLGWFTITAPLVYGGCCGEPPSGSERITGPHIEGVFTAIPGAVSTEAIATFVGSCKKVAVSFGPSIIGILKPFEQLTSDADILNMRFEGTAAQATCFPGEPGKLILSGVSKLNNSGTVLGADVSVSLVQNK
jgi:hypothetical protein